jgi:AraC-like DNA-binding protein
MMELFICKWKPSCPAKQAFKRKLDHADREKLFAIKEYWKKTYLEALTLKDLTFQFGLNEFKLKKGFRHFFQSTVFGRIHHLRMEKAKELLLKRQMNVSEVAYFIGYNNIGSFSRIQEAIWLFSKACIRKGISSAKRWK